MNRVWSPVWLVRKLRKMKGKMGFESFFFYVALVYENENPSKLLL